MAAHFQLPLSFVIRKEQKKTDLTESYIINFMPTVWATGNKSQVKIKNVGDLFRRF